MKKLLLIFALFLSISVYGQDFLRHNPFKKNYSYSKFQTDIINYNSYFINLKYNYNCYYIPENYGFTILRLRFY